ncbi:beta-phosphoglucomutase family hydrolase [Arthrobacter sp. H14-L1]|uniref:beta-phosphoglucomutase family hydrolase n=1 Tax=Arthrobacter sp. H14-L1 TaxID=2996697 RepID=UPI002271D651|nr:beta-phosphoglucomutase family hydrolase [Arthrobacter sp. H14-L1]MCY0905170.1 beta-phosphoglucomutase family hydrolase [Arthrobacter sp. H14-L1]
MDSDRSSPGDSSSTGRAPTTGAVSVGLPVAVRACLFDLDGVLTKTASVHAAAWKEMFDAYLRDVTDGTGQPFVPFDPGADYDQYVDGKSRADGTRSFLASRGITLPEGNVDGNSRQHVPVGRGGEAGGRNGETCRDIARGETVQSLGDHKNLIVLRKLKEDGVEVYNGSVSYVHAVRRAGLRCAVVSSSENCRAVLASAGIEDLFDAHVDGITARNEKLRGKPAPDMFLAAARVLAMTPQQCAVFEDALAGVAAGRAGGFAQVVGVDRAGQAPALHDAGADVVVSDLADLLGPDCDIPDGTPAAREQP